MQRRARSNGSSDRLGLAMLAGALLGFAVGAVIGLGSSAIDAPVLAPFIGAAVGVLCAALVAGALGMSGARRRGRQEATRRELDHLRLRDEAHRGWIEGIDLAAEAPRPLGERFVAAVDQVERPDEAE